MRGVGIAWESRASTDGRECRFRVIQWAGRCQAGGQRDAATAEMRSNGGCGEKRQPGIYLAVRVRFAAGTRTPAALLGSTSAAARTSAVSGAAIGAPLRLEPETEAAGAAFAPALARAAPVGFVTASAEPAPAAASDAASVEAVAPAARAETRAAAAARSSSRSLVKGRGIPGSEMTGSATPETRTSKYPLRGFSALTATGSPHPSFFSSASSSAALRLKSCQDLQASMVIVGDREAIVQAKLGDGSRTGTGWRRELFDRRGNRTDFATNQQPRG